MLGNPAVNLQDFSRELRRIIIDQSMRAGVGHIGSALSVVDILAALYGRVLDIAGPEDADRDRFVLSKGHAALALYGALHLRGWLTPQELNTYCTDGTLLGVHPEHELRGVDFSTGSLGQGVTLATGAALAARLQRSERRAFALLSDAECNEGCVWEAAMFAGHQQLANLVLVIDQNGQQALGYTRDVNRADNLGDRWRAFGWDVVEVDGHNPELLAHTIGSLNMRSGPPHVLVARTVFGKGVPFMEGQIKWHYAPLGPVEYAEALLALEVAA